MAQFPTLSENALRILHELRERAMDGYTVMSRTRLSQEELREALKEFSQLSGPPLVKVKGDASGPAVGAAYLWVPPDAKGDADFLLGNRR